MKKRLIILILLTTFLAAGSTAGADTSRLGKKSSYASSNITDHLLYTFKGVVGNVDETAETISVAGRTINIVEDLEMKDKTVTTILSDEDNKIIPLGSFKVGYTVKVSAFRFPNKSFVATLVKIVSEKKKTFDVK